MKTIYHATFPVPPFPEIIHILDSPVRAHPGQRNLWG
jgi:hypothetical protein